MLRLAHLAAAVIGAAVLTAGTASVQAQGEGTFRGLNKTHTAFGVAQFHYLNIFEEPDNIKTLRLRNPIDSDMAVATFVYTRGSTVENDESPTEVYVGCRVDSLTPHGSKVIREQYIPDNPYGTDPDASGEFPGGARYLEIVAAPHEPVNITDGDGNVTRQSRVANGLGIAVTRRNNGAIEDSFPAHPRIFSLPMDLEGVLDPDDETGETELGTNQRAESQACVCDGVNTLGLDFNVFQPFGIICPRDP